MEIYLIRHGETDWNRQKRLQGQSDTELNEYGRELAGVTGIALENTPVDIIYSSPLIRAYETANLIRGHRNIRIIRDDRIKEINFGTYEGKETEQVKNDGSGRLEKFFNETENFTPPQGGESIKELRARTQSFLDEVILPCEGKYDHVMIVAHGACNSAIRCNMLRLSDSEFWKGSFQYNCCVSTIELENGIYTMKDECRTYYEIKNPSRLSE